MPGVMSFLPWADLSEEQLKEIYFLSDPKPTAPKTTKEALGRAVGLEGYGEDPKKDIELDFYMDVLAKCQSMELSYEKTSTFFSAMKLTHRRAVDERLPVDRCFTAFKDLLLKHSVHRPPYSIAIFTLAELKELSEWGLENYFRYYKLYQYIYTPRIKVRNLQLMKMMTTTMMMRRRMIMRRRRRTAAMRMMLRMMLRTAAI